MRATLPVFMAACIVSLVAPRVANAQVIPEFPPPAASGLIANFPPPVALDPFDNGARSPNELRAADAFQRGNMLAAANRYHDAALAFEESYAALPRPSTLYDIAQSYRAAAEPMPAIAAYRRYLALGSMSPARRAAVNAVIAGLEHRLANVTVRPTPADATITVDGVPTAPAARVAIEPGRHRLTVNSPGRSPVNQIFRVREGENRDLVVALDHRPVSQQAWFWGLLAAAFTSAAITTTAIVLVAHPGGGAANCGTLDVCTR